MDKELREKIQQVLLQYMSAIHAELIHSHDDVFLTDKILTLIKEAGYVKLADDQGLPQEDGNHTWYKDDFGEAGKMGYRLALEDTVKAGWQKIELG